MLVIISIVTIIGNFTKSMSTLSKCLSTLSKSDKHLPPTSSKDHLDSHLLLTVVFLDQELALLQQSHLPQL